MRARWICLGFAVLILALGADPANAQLFGRKTTEEAPPTEPKIPVVTVPFEVERMATGLQFKSYVGVVDDLMNETIVAQGACVITLGKYRDFPRVANEIRAAAAAGADVTGGGEDGQQFLTNLLQFGKANQGDVHCRIERGTETGCITDLCATAKPFNSYLVSYGPGGKVLGMGVDGCGGSFMRALDDCEPKAANGSGSAPAGFAVCIETAIALKGSKEDQVSSVVIGHGKLPRSIKAQTGEGNQPHEPRAALAERVSRHHVADLELAAHGIHRRDGEKHDVEKYIQSRNDAGAEQQYTRQTPVGIRHFSNEVGGGIPAGIGVVHVDQRHGEARAAHKA